MFRCGAAVVLLLVAVAQAADLKYADLSADHVVDLGIEVFHSNADNGELVAYNGGKPCLADDEACQEPVFEYDNGAELTVNFKAPKNVAKLTLKSFDNEEIGAPVAILFKACYEKGWTVDRKWRKAKDVITKDKRCGKKLKTVPIGDTEFKYKFPSNTPKAQWFITAYIKCAKPGSEETVNCGLDTTGGIKVLDKEAGDVKTSPTIYYKTGVTDSRSTGLYVAVIILSICSVSLLVGFFIFEHLTQKNK